MHFMRTKPIIKKKFFACFLGVLFVLSSQFNFGQTASLKISNSGNSYSLQSDKERLSVSGTSLLQSDNLTEKGYGSDWVGDGIFSKFKPAQEVIERRDRTSKHFRNPDGSYSAIISSGSSLNYQDESGNWKTVCRDIEPSQSTPGYAFKNESNSFKTYFPSVANGNGIKTVLKEGEIHDFLNPKMLWLDAQGNVINTNSNSAFCADSKGELSAEKADELIYKNVFSNTDVQFVQTNDGRKQNYILKSNSVIADMPKGSVSIAFSEDLIIPDNWIVVCNKTGNKLDDIYNDNKTIRTISLINQEGIEIFRYLLPVYYDNNGEMIEGSFLAEINSNTLTIKTVVSTDWLLSQDRAFPVVIDPDVSVYPTYAADWTGQCNSAGGGGNYNLAVGRASSGTYYRGWNRFNTSSVPDGSLY
ncbi:MAG TPA: hypothetical protein PKN41_09960 [Bacteroidales bacterium]|nr:hypothetical protein [Bacteroidales bacterium]